MTGPPGFPAGGRLHERITDAATTVGAARELSAKRAQTGRWAQGRCPIMKGFTREEKYD